MPNSKLPSRFQINDEVLFTQPDQPLRAIEGQIIAIRFTRSKIYYDILDVDYGEVYKNVQSDYVTSMSLEYSSDYKSSHIND